MRAIALARLPLRPPMRARLLLLLSLVLSFATWPAQATPAVEPARNPEAERMRIAAERRSVEQRHDSEAAACRDRFAVTACIDAAQERRRVALEPLRADAWRLDAAERQRRAAERRAAIGAKQEALAARPVTRPSDLPLDAAAAPPTAATVRQDADDAPAAGGPPPPSKLSRSGSGSGGDAPSRASAAERRARKSAAAASAAAGRVTAAQSRQAEADATRQRIAQRQAERAGSGKASQPLPLPLALPATALPGPQTPPVAGTMPR